jgi:hypothetical protein
MRIMGHLKEDEEEFRPIFRKEMELNKALHLGKNILDRIALWGFPIAAAWAMISALGMRWAEQDTWILDGIWLPLAITLILYVICTMGDLEQQYFVILTCTVTFLLYALPALKYAFPYGSTTDVATHMSMLRTIAQTGQVDPYSVYWRTPGFHVIGALLSRLSGVDFVFWAKVVPASLGSLVPLAFYMLCKRASVPASMTRVVVVLSGTSLPLLYTLNGTSFTAPVFVFFVMVFLLRELSRGANYLKVSYTIMSFLFSFSIVTWHASTSFVVPVVFVLAGVLFVFDRGRSYFLEGSTALVWLGLLGIVGALSYWMYDANLLWGHFARSAGEALQPDVTPDLIPPRLFTLSLGDRALMGLFYHARDGLLIVLSGLGIVLLIWAGRKEASLRLLRTYGLIWLLFAAILPLLFIVGFGTLGYKRFLVYGVTLSPLLAGYSVWRGSTTLQRYVPWLSEQQMSSIAVIVVFVFSAIQLYPYQPAVPTLDGGSSGVGPPVVWLHAVNSAYQYHMLRFAGKIPDDRQVIADYVGHKQYRMFFGTDAQSRLRQETYQRPEPAFLLLHWPGRPGAYTEPAEYRSAGAIEAWRVRPGMSTVYDNGGSFVLYYPENGRDPFSLGR